MDFSHFVDRAFWTALTGSALFMASQMHEIGTTVAELNMKMATVIEKMSDQDRRIERLERIMERHQRIRD